MELTDTAIRTIGAVVCFIVFVAYFKRNIAAMLARATKIEFKLFGILIEAPAQEFLLMFERMYSKLLQESHVEFYRKVVRKKESPEVIEMIPDFNRQSEDWLESDRGKEVLGMLRALRGLGFIEPKEGGKWQSDKHIVITEFGSEMYRYMKN